MPISKAKAALVKAGWEPRETALKDQFGDLERDHGETRVVFEAGFHEVEYCNGTGQNLCFFNYRKGRRCLRVQTLGEFSEPSEPVVVRLEAKCAPLWRGGPHQSR